MIFVFSQAVPEFQKITHPPNPQRPSRNPSNYIIFPGVFLFFTFFCFTNFNFPTTFIPISVLPAQNPSQLFLGKFFCFGFFLLVLHKKKLTRNQLSREGRGLPGKV